jgi:hypothetical protein
MSIDRQPRRPTGQERCQFAVGDCAHETAHRTVSPRLRVPAYPLSDLRPPTSDLRPPVPHPSSHRPNGHANAWPRAFRAIQHPQAVQRLPLRRSQARQVCKRWRNSASSTSAQPSPTKATTDWKRFVAWSVSGGNAGWLAETVSPLPYAGEGQGVREIGPVPGVSLLSAPSEAMVTCDELGAGLLGYWTGAGNEPPDMTMITFSPPNSVLLILRKLPVFGGWHLCFLRRHHY